MDQVAVGVSEDLHLDVTGPAHVALQEHPVVAERRRRLPSRGGHRLGQVGGRLDQAHALTTAPGRRFYQQRVVHWRVVGGVVRRRQDGDPSGGGCLLGGQFVAHGGDHRRGRTDPGQAGLLDGGREAGVLGQEPVSRVHGVRSGGQRSGDHRVTVQVPAG